MKDEELLRLGFRVDNHDTRLNNVEGRVNLLHKDLGELKKVLLIIKWWLMGVGSLYIVEQIGLLPLVKKFVGI